MKKNNKAIYLFRFIVAGFLLSNFIIATTISNAETLKVQGVNPLSEMGKSFAQSNPTIEVEYEPMQLINTTSDFINAVLTGEFEFDVFLVRTFCYDYQRLIQKGYCLNLEPNENMMNKIKSMYESVQKELLIDDILYGVPIALRPEYCYYVPDAWQKAGYGLNDVPASFMDLCEFIEKWAIRIETDSVEDVCLNNMVDDYASWLVNLLMEQYIIQCQNTSGTVNFHSPAFRDLLIRLKKAGELMNQNEQSKEGMSLFGYNASNGIGNLQCFIPLRLTAFDPIFIKASLEVLCINPKSRYQNKAYDYLENALFHLEPIESAKLYVGQTESIEDSHYSSNLEDWTIRERELQDRLAGTTDPDGIANIRVELERLNHARESIERNRFLATHEALVCYQTSTNYIFFPPPSVLDPTLPEGQELKKMIKIYLADDIDVDDFIEKLNKIASLLEIEDW